MDFFFPSQGNFFLLEAFQYPLVAATLCGFFQADFPPQSVPQFYEPGTRLRALSCQFRAIGTFQTYCNPCMVLRTAFLPLRAFWYPHSLQQDSSLGPVPSSMGGLGQMGGAPSASAAPPLPRHAAISNFFLLEAFQYPLGAATLCGFTACLPSQVVVLFASAADVSFQQCAEGVQPPGFRGSSSPHFSEELLGEVAYSSTPHARSVLCFSRALSGTSTSSMNRNRSPSSRTC